MSIRIGNSVVSGTVNMSGGWRRNVTLWGDVKLNAKPTWAT